MDNYEEKLNKLPKEAQDLLLSDYGRYLNMTIRKEHKIKGLNMSFLADTVARLYFGDLHLNDLSDYLQRNLQVNEAKARELALDILGKRVLSVRDYLPGQDVLAAIRSLDGRSESYEHYVRTAEEMIEREHIALILDVDINFSNPESEYEKEKLLINMKKIRQIILTGTDKQKRGLLELINQNSKWLTAETLEKLQNPDSVLGKSVRSSLAM